jgi:hypothetical protein
MRCTARTKVRHGGVYNVLHLGHRPPHKSILQYGEKFPECRRCGTAVVFEFVAVLTESDEIEHVGYDRDFMDAVLGPLVKAG